MTIACCLVLPEGVIFASDSTVSEGQDGRFHYLNHNQKIYEFGEGSTIGVMTWGLSALGRTGHRTVIARTADDFFKGEASSLKEAASQLAENIWNEFQIQFENQIKEYRDIDDRVRDMARSSPDVRSKEDDIRLRILKDEISVGFCIGGHSGHLREPEAYWFEIDPSLRSPPYIYSVDSELIKGQPEYFYRMYDGHDRNIRDKILNSAHWNGGPADLDNILSDEFIIPPELTMRDAIDFAHFIVYSTVKTIKFSTKDQVCGGPIEIAVITTDRRFRWVKHKSWDAAIEL
jgi:hypothetical protein